MMVMIMMIITMIVLVMVVMVTMIVLGGFTLPRVLDWPSVDHLLVDSNSCTCNLETQPLGFLGFRRIRKSGAPSGLARCRGTIRGYGC